MARSTRHTGRRSRDYPVKTTNRQTSWTALLFFMIGGALSGWYIIYQGAQMRQVYDAISSQEAANDANFIVKTELDSATTPLYISLDELASSRMIYTAKWHPLAKGFTPDSLQDIPLPHGASDTPMKLDSHALDRLTALFKAAESQGKPLMVSSAYRSIAEQQKLLDDFISKKGEAMAHQYVAQPGTSEHHTGLSADITDASGKCTQNSDYCNLSPATAAWLAENAPKYGFIIRYPSQKEPITGISYEPWHLRYIGVVPARVLTESGLTYDEFLEQVAPGRMKKTQQ